MVVFQNFPERVSVLDRFLVVGIVLLGLPLRIWFCTLSHNVLFCSALLLLALEIELGNIVGKGGFFTVSEVKKIHLHDDENDENDAVVVKSANQKDEDEDYILSVVQDRKFMQTHTVRNDGKDCRYAFKTMRNASRTDPTLFVNTIVDLALEAKFLSSVRHPNIIKMRAMAVGDPCQSEYFIVLDRLYDTLNDRVTTWQKKQCSGFAKLFDFQKKKEKNFLAQRLTVAYDVASAIEYLHNLK
jgi:serine/threonine protein kinase